MSALSDFHQILNESERRLIDSLTAPAQIQSFLDSLPYSTDQFYRCPLRVLKDRVAHCFDGALFAAMALRLLGFSPLILEMVPNDRDDDHLLALYKVHGYWGAVAKSNFIGLRFREPIFRNLRELVMSYFEQYYNVEREKTLRSYTLPLNLEAFDRFKWMTHDESVERIAKKLDEARKIPILTPSMISNLSLVDERSYRAGLIGANEKGLYPPSFRD